MTMFKEYSSRALPLIEELIVICEEVGEGQKLARLLSLLELARDEIKETAQ